MRDRSGALAETIAAVRAAAGLVLPVSCAGCGRPDAVLCPGCRAAVLEGPVLVRRAGPLLVCSGAPFSGVVAEVLRRAKEQARPGLVAALGPVLRRAALAAIDEAAAPPGPVRAVVVPPRLRALRERGFRVVEVATRHAGMRPHRDLRHTRQAADQRTLRRGERFANAAGSMAARPGRHGRSVLLVDDVVTTGATVAEAARALTAAGSRVVAAVTIAATPPPGPGGEKTRRSGDDTGWAHD